ncbi:MAG: glycosyltransferase family 2 protein [Ignavibacteria bacterium]|nr:glycosyltransferase family 2 protein [Ignavibacteria bacterium]
MISSIVITYNEESNIKECLETLKWTDEIIVIDSGSTDATVNIAKEFTDKVFVIDNIPYGLKRNVGIEKAKGEWIIWLDADERVTTELKEEILQITSRKDADDAYLINRKSFFISKFIKHSGWYPDYTLRLFRRTANIKFDAAKVHEKTNYKGTASKLNNELLHYTDRDFEHYTNKMNRYTTLSAQELCSKNKNASTSYFDIIFRPAFSFFKMYFLKLGFLDGYMGLVLCTLSSIHVMMKYSKLYFLNKTK